MTRSPATRRWWKRRLPVAGQDQHNGENDGHEEGGGGRAVGRIRVQPGMDAEKQKDHQDRKRDAVTGDASKEPEVGCEGSDIGDGAEGTSFAVTLVLVAPLAICVLGAGTAGWEHIAVAGGYWCVLFGVSFWVVRRWGSSEGAPLKAAFVECRLAIALIGYAAVTFRSPVLLEVVPDILAVAIAAAGCMDGIVVGDSRRLQAAARSLAAGRETAEERQ